MQTHLRRIVRKRQLKAVTGYGPTQIHQLIKLGEFPAPVSLSDSGRAKGWWEDEVIAWQEKRQAKRFVRTSDNDI